MEKNIEIAAASMAAMIQTATSKTYTSETLAALCESLIALSTEHRALLAERRAAKMVDVAMAPEVQ